MHEIILPRADILATLRVDHLALTHAHSIAPVAIVFAAIGPLADTDALANAVAHLLGLLIIDGYDVTSVFTRIVVNLLSARSHIAFRNIN